MAARKGSAEKLHIPHTRIDNEDMIGDHYTIGELLGQGTFGTVHEALHIATGERWAIKGVNKEKAGSSAIQLLEREVQILKRVDHEHIIRLNEIFETSSRMFLVMELCEGGELADELKKKGHLNESDTKNILERLASAISYLHKHDIVHRDMKLENVLLSQNPNDPSDKFYIKVTDFGLSVVKDGTGHDNMMEDFCGTPIYMSPEILDNKAYSQQCDVWALGIIIYMLISGKPPFHAADNEGLYALIRKAEILFTDDIWTDISEDLKSCIQGMLKLDPAHRLTASEVLFHPCITGQTGCTTNVLEMMKQWTDLRINDGDSDEDDGAINGDIADESKPETSDSDVMPSELKISPKTSPKKSPAHSAAGKAVLDTAATRSPRAPLKLPGAKMSPGGPGVNRLGRIGTHPPSSPARHRTSSPARPVRRK